MTLIVFWKSILKKIQQTAKNVWKISWHAKSNVQSRRGSRKFCQGVRVQKKFFFLTLVIIFYWSEKGTRGLYQYSKQATIGPPAKRHFNGVSLVGRWWCLVIAWYFWGVRTPCPPLWIRAFKMQHLFYCCLSDELFAFISWRWLYY